MTGAPRSPMQRLGAFARRRRWSRPAGAFAVAIIFATSAFVAFAWRAGDDMVEEIEAGHLRLAQLAASQADRVVVEAFFEIEQMALLADLDAPMPDSGRNDRFASMHDRAARFHSGVVVLDGQGRVIFAEPHTAAEVPASKGLLTQASEADDRTTSPPWIDPVTQHAMTALSVPMYHSDGTRAGAMIGILDLAEPLISDLILSAARLGESGHADLVDESGIVLASTNPEHVLSLGDHPAFYAKAASQRVSQSARAAHVPRPGDLDTSARHLMAYVPLQNAPWGLALGAEEAELIRPARRFEYRLLVFGTASVVVMLLATALLVRRIPDPRRDGSF